MLQIYVYNFFFVVQDLTIWLTNQFLFLENSFSEELGSYWVLTLYIAHFFSWK